VLPKQSIGDPPWTYHATTAVEAHCVDVLTGVDGTPRELYLHEHWKEPDALCWSEIDPDEAS